MLIKNAFNGFGWYDVLIAYLIEWNTHHAISRTRVKSFGELKFGILRIWQGRVGIYFHHVLAIYG